MTYAKKALTLFLVGASAGFLPETVKAQQSLPAMMRWGKTYDVPGFGPIETRAYTIRIYIRGNGTVLSLLPRTNHQMIWLEIPAFYEAPIETKILRNERLLNLGQASSEIKKAVVVDLPGQKVIDEISMLDYALSPDARFLAFTRAIAPHYDDEADGSEVTAIYDFDLGPEENRSEPSPGSRGREVGLRVYPGLKASEQAGRAPSTIRVYAHESSYQWAADSKSISFIEAIQRFSGAVNRQMSGRTEFLVVLAHVAHGKVRVRTAGRDVRSRRINLRKRIDETGIHAIRHQGRGFRSWPGQVRSARILGTRNSRAMTSVAVPGNAGFPPVAAPDARVLILGSLPGRDSLRRQEYYARPANCFWWIMGELAGAGPELPYQTRLARLIERRIALWDVCASAIRPGSLDARIVAASVVPNDIAGFLAGHPLIETICLNGGAAAAMFARHIRPGLASAQAALPQRRLPSTSPAFAAQSRAAKLAVWKEALARVAA